MVWSERLYQRVHRSRIERLRRGELDGAGFERAQRAWSRNLTLLLFGLFTLVAAGMDWATSTRPRAEQLERTLYLVGILAVLGVVVALRVSQFARFGARNFLIRRTREVAAPGVDLTSGLGAGTKPIASLADGTHQLSTSHANRVLMLAMVASLALGGVIVARPALIWIAPILAVVVGRAIFMRFDRRPFSRSRRRGSGAVAGASNATPGAPSRRSTRAKIGCSAASRSFPTPFLTSGARSPGWRATRSAPATGFRRTSAR